MPTGVTLYGVSDELVALENSLDTCETAEQRAECEAQIARASDALLHKVDDFSRFLAHLDSQDQLAKQEIERLKTRQQVFQRTQKRLEEYAVNVMQQLNLKKLDGDFSQLRLQQN